MIHPLTVYKMSSDENMSSEALDFLKLHAFLDDSNAAFTEETMLADSRATSKLESHGKVRQ